MARSSAACQPVAQSIVDQRIKRIMDELYLVDPCLGSRRLVTVLERNHGISINRKRVRRLRWEPAAGR